MSSGTAPLVPPAIRRARICLGMLGGPRAVLSIALLCGLSACAGHSYNYASGANAARVRNYAPPGPPGDPWGPYIREASARFGTPEIWIREVMRQESRGQEYLNGRLTTSPVGAMGLMQVMPVTYGELRGRYGLGPDPYDPHDNILAGAAYIREMYDRFGSPAFLAAYNAGPRRLEGYLFEGRPLPGETIAYVAAVAPRLGGSSTLPSPLAVYANAAADASSDDLNRKSLAGALPATQAGAAVSIPATIDAGDASDTASDDLNRKALMASWPQPSTPPLPTPGVTLVTAVAAPSQAPRAGIASGRWGVQVGAFSSPAQARAAAEAARQMARGSLDAAETAVGSVARSDGTVLYRARLIGVSTDAASEGCGQLIRAQMACVIISPDAQT